jgi:hypothetical protein
VKLQRNLEKIQAILVLANTTNPVDALLESTGQGNIRMAPYRCDLSLVWSTVEGHVADRNIERRFRAFGAFVQESSSSVTKEGWRARCHNTKETELK